MFQPQPTPYSPFSSYGIAPPIPEFSPFQSASALVVDSGGAVFRGGVFSPVVASNNRSAPGRSSFSVHQNNSAPQYKMAGNNDMEAQEVLAREFQPVLEVG
jgi:hypothetical protein